MEVTDGSDATYSSYVWTMTDSVVAVDLVRTFAVSWVPHWRANESKAASRIRLCSRARVVGRRKS
jgi:hypothetical protein